MSFQLKPSDLEEIYETIRKDELEQTSDLEDLVVMSGATSSLATQLFRLSSHEEITLTDRLSGISRAHPKLKLDVQLAKIRIRNCVQGIALVRQSDYCNKCMKMPSCDRVEAGSILFTRTMCTGYVEEDISYRKSLNSFVGDCPPRFISHPHSTDPRVLMNKFTWEDVLPVLGIKNMEDVRSFSGDVNDRIKHPAYLYPPNMTMSDVWLDICNMMILNSKTEKIDYAVYCAGIIKNAYEETRKNLFTNSLARTKRLGQSIEKRVHRKLHGLEYCPKCLAGTEDIRMQGFDKEHVYYQCHKCRHKWTRPR